MIKMKIKNSEQQQRWIKKFISGFWGMFQNIIIVNKKKVGPLK